MANHKSSQKRARQTIVRTGRNTMRLSRVRTAVRSFRRAAQNNNDPQALEAAFAHATRELRKAASAGVLHGNTASRRVSRLAAARNKAISAGAAK